MPLLKFVQDEVPQRVVTLLEESRLAPCHQPLIGAVVFESKLFYEVRGASGSWPDVVEPAIVPRFLPIVQADMTH